MSAVIVLRRKVHEIEVKDVHTRRITDRNSCERCTCENFTAFSGILAIEANGHGRRNTFTAGSGNLSEYLLNGFLDRLLGKILDVWGAGEARSRYRSSKVGDL